MRAIVLAAGRGRRLRQVKGKQSPKCLLQFGGMSLLERHLRMLRQVGVEDVVLAVGFQYQLVEAELDRLQWQPQPEIVLNPRFEQGSMATVRAVTHVLSGGGDVLLMDADVLYDERILRPLTDGRGPANRLLMDCSFEPNAEAVKVCVHKGLPIELRKQIPDTLTYERIGESIGFFRLTESAARRVAAIAAEYIDDGQVELPHEEALRDLLLERSASFEIVEVTGAPWIEIDFPDDVARAQDIVRHLHSPVGVFA
jgi:choline kinase